MSVLPITETKYNAAWLTSQPLATQKKFLNGLSDKAVQSLRYDWRFWAREKQLPPPGDWFVWLIRSGRGFGKTWTGANWTIEQAKENPGVHIAIVGQTKADVRDVLVELGDSSILRLSPPDFCPAYEASKRRLSWPNGSVATLYSGDEPNQLRGPQHSRAWVDELAKYKYASETWDNLEMGLRQSDAPRVCVTTTPRPIPIIKMLLKDADTHDVTGSTYENAAHLSSRWLKRIQRYEGTRIGRQELHGEMLGDVLGALWDYGMMDKARVAACPPLDVTHVSIDPATTKKRKSNLTGIIVVGRLGNRDNAVYYVKEDLSGQYGPEGWARKALLAAQEHKALRIAIEDNQGGDMCESTLRMVAKEMYTQGELQSGNVSVKRIHAKKSKGARAEEASVLYHHERVMHVGQFPELEDQMCTWVPGEGESPDRVDALVHGLGSLRSGGALWI